MSFPLFVFESQGSVSFFYPIFQFSTSFFNCTSSPDTILLSHVLVNKLILLTGFFLVGFEPFDATSLIFQHVHNYISQYRAHTSPMPLTTFLPFLSSQLAVVAVAAEMFWAILGCSMLGMCPCLICPAFPGTFRKRLALIIRGESLQTYFFVSIRF